MLTVIFQACDLVTKRNFFVIGFKTCSSFKCYLFNKLKLMQAMQHFGHYYCLLCIFPLKTLNHF